MAASKLLPDDHPALLTELKQRIRESQLRASVSVNLKYMRAFADAWPEEEFVQQVAAQIPWFHNCVLLDKLDRIW